MNRIQRLKAALRTTGWTFTIFYPSAFVTIVSLAVTMGNYSSAQLSLIVLPIVFTVCVFLGLRLSLSKILVNYDLVVEHPQAPSNLSIAVYLRFVWGVWWRNALFISVVFLVLETFFPTALIPTLINVLIGLISMFFACFWLYSKQFGKTKIVPRKEVG